MRRTVTLDPEVSVELRREMHRTGKSMKAVVNAALRSGLGGGQPAQPQPFEIMGFVSGLERGCDPDEMK